jgi:type III pantothenate kinase
MLFAVDIGNTNIVCGLFSGDKLTAKARIATEHRKTTDEYGTLLTSILALRIGTDEPHASGQVSGMAVSSVVPQLTGIFRELGMAYFGVEPLIVGPGIRTELAVKYDDPRKVGADRIVNAVAGIFLYKPPLVIIDFGTALTFCAVTRDREYIGGAIFPGMQTSYASLAERAALLSMIDFRMPKNPVGRSTEESLLSGAINGYASVVEGMVQRFKGEIGEDATVLGTGGMVHLVAQATDVFHHIDPDLTLKGLKILYNLNRERTDRPD